MLSDPMVYVIAGLCIVAGITIGRAVCRAFGLDN